MVVQTERQYTTWYRQKTPCWHSMYVDLGTRCRCIIGPVGKTARPPQVTLRYGPHRRAARTCSLRYGNAAWLANIDCECDPRLDVGVKRSFGSRGSGTCKMQH